MERSSDFRVFACQFRVQGGSPKTLPEKSSIFHDVKSEKKLGKRLPWRKQSISCSSSKLSALSALSELRKNVAVFFLKESLREKKGAKRACRGVKSKFPMGKRLYIQAPNLRYKSYSFCTLLKTIKLSFHMAERRSGFSLKMTDLGPFTPMTMDELTHVQRQMCAAHATGRGVLVRTTWRTKGNSELGMMAGDSLEWSGAIHGVENGIPHIKFPELPRNSTSTFPNQQAEYSKVTMSFAALQAETSTRARDEEPDIITRMDAERFSQAPAIRDIGASEAAMLASHFSDAQLMNTKGVGPFRIPDTEGTWGLLYPNKWHARAWTVGAEVAFDSFDALITTRMMQFNLQEAPNADCNASKELFKMWLVEAAVINAADISDNIWRMGFTMLQGFMRVGANAKKGKQGLIAFNAAIKSAQKKCMDYDEVWDAVLKTKDKDEPTLTRFVPPSPSLLPTQSQMPQENKFRRNNWGSKNGRRR